MAETSARISFVTAKGKREKLDRIAEGFGTNLSAVLNEAVDHYIELHEWQLAHIEKGVEQAQKGEFASEKEVDRFFKKFGKGS